MKGKVVLHCFVACASMFLIGCGAKNGPSVATVNGEPIDKDEFYSYLERKPAVQVQTPNGAENYQVAGTLGLQALTDLVNRRLLLQQAKKAGVFPTDAEVDKELAFQSKLRPDFVSYLTAQGMTLQQIRNDLQVDIARRKLLTKGIDVPMSDVDLYIKENPEKFMEPAQAEVLYVVVGTPDKKAQVDQELATGQNFQVVATRYSEAPRARELGGTYPETLLEKMPKQLQNVVKVTNELSTSDWIKDGQNWVKFYVQKKSEAKPLVLDDARKELVRRQLAMERGERANDLTRMLEAELRSAKIDVQSEGLRGPWNKAYEQLRARVAMK